jgi:hypothetical protein
MLSTAFRAGSTREHEHLCRSMASLAPTACRTFSTHMQGGTVLCFDSIKLRLVPRSTVHSSGGFCWQPEAPKHPSHHVGRVPLVTRPRKRHVF